MSDDGKRTGLWGKLARGLFEFDAPLTANLLPLLPDPARQRRGGGGRRAAGGVVADAVPDEMVEIDLQERGAEAVDEERAALVVVHGHAPGERFDLEAGSVTLGAEDDAVLSCDEDGVTLRARGPAAEVRVDFRRMAEARLEHGVLVGIGGTIFKFLRCRDLEGAHFDELYRLHRFDGLTDVYHERYLRHRLRSAVSHARRHLSLLALVVLDLEPRVGRGAALSGPAHDLVLREVARVARGVIGEGELLGRHGSGQLVLVLPGHDVAGATPRAEALRAAVAAAPIVIDGQRVAPGPSIGVAVLDRGMLVHEDLLRAALAAMPARA